MRGRLIGGNWKMHLTRTEAEALATAIGERFPRHLPLSGVVFPPFPYLEVVQRALRNTPVLLGAQNLYPANEGAFTGEVSPAMLVDVGCKYVIVGHSERRHKLGEMDAFINRKVCAALAAGLTVILCVGETLLECEANQTEKVLDTQVTAGLANVAAADMAKVVLAYEPVWAIGTGKNATPDQAQQAHTFLRGRVAHLHGAEVAQTLVIQYGGSVKADNAASLMAQPDVDGALVGGASLQPDQFLAIVKAAGMRP